METFKLVRGIIVCVLLIIVGAIIIIYTSHPGYGVGAIVASVCNIYKFSSKLNELNKKN
jgi:hypothetical protein